MIEIGVPPALVLLPIARAPGEVAFVVKNPPPIALLAVPVACTLRPHAVPSPVAVEPDAVCGSDPSRLPPHTNCAAAGVGANTIPGTTQAWIAAIPISNGRLCCVNMVIPFFCAEYMLPAADRHNYDLQATI